MSRSARSAGGPARHAGGQQRREVARGRVLEGPIESGRRDVGGDELARQLLHGVHGSLVLVGAGCAQERGGAINLDQAAAQRFRGELTHVQRN